MEVFQLDWVGVRFVLTASVTWGFRGFLGGFLCSTVQVKNQVFYVSCLSNQLKVLIYFQWLPLLT